jgi:phosphonate utilization transcriptional regulator
MLKTPPAPDAGTARAVPAARRTSAGRAHPGGAAPPAPPPAAQASARGAHTIALLRSQSLPALVQQEIERMIVAGDLPIGSKLNEVDVAAMLGVSRGPVREAFRALEMAGLVRLEKNRGVFVRQIPVEEADEIYELRAVLDEFVGRRLAQVATPETVRELRARIERMEKAAARSDVDAYYRANVEFHDRLVELAGNSKLLSTYRRLVNELLLFRHATLARSGTLAVSCREHREIVERIAAGQSAAAGRALHDHVMASRERMHAAEKYTPKAPAARATARKPR